MDTSGSRQTQNVDLGAFRVRYYQVVTFRLREQNESRLNYLRTRSLRSVVNEEDGVVIQQASTRQEGNAGKLTE